MLLFDIWKIIGSYLHINDFITLATTNKMLHQLLRCQDLQQNILVYEWNKLAILASLYGPLGALWKFPSRSFEKAQIIAFKELHNAYSEEVWLRFDKKFQKVAKMSRAGKYSADEDWIKMRKAIGRMYDIKKYLNKLITV